MFFQENFRCTFVASPNNHPSSNKSALSSFYLVSCTVGTALPCYVCILFSVLSECHCLHMWARYTCCEVLATFSSIHIIPPGFLLASWKDIGSHIHLSVHPSNSNEFLLLSFMVFPWCWYRGHFLARLPSYRLLTEFPIQSWRDFSHGLVEERCST